MDYNSVYMDYIRVHTTMQSRALARPRLYSAICLWNSYSLFVALPCGHYTFWGRFIHLFALLPITPAPPSCAFWKRLSRACCADASAQ